MEEFNTVGIRDMSIMQVRTEPGKSGIDFGAGFGFITEGLLNAGCRVLAVEQSPEAVRFLEQRFGHLKEVRIVSSGYLPVSLESECADYVFAHMHLVVSTCPDKSVAEMARLVRQGGKVAVTDLLMHNNNELTKKYNHMWPGFTLPDIYEWFVVAGLKNISIESAGNVSLPDGIFSGMILAYGEK